MSNDSRPGLSAIQLALVFLTGVAVCAVFFALGFAVARNQQAPTVSAESNTEQVPPPAPVPTPVNGAAGRTTNQNTTPAPATAEGGIVLRTLPAPSSGLSAFSAAPSPAPPARVRESPPKIESKRVPAAPISSSTPSAASQLTLAPNAVAATPAAPATGGKIVVQVSAVRVQQDGEALVNLLKSRGYPAFLVTPEAAGAGDKLFRVQVGPYKTDPEAAGVRNKLVADGFKPFVRH